MPSAGLAGLIGGISVAAVAVGGLALWLRRRYVVVTVQGHSMQPSLRPGERVLVRRCGLVEVRRGDIVVLEPPTPLPYAGRLPPTGRLRGRRWNVKRVTALPGDPVPAGVAGDGELVVPQGALVVLGDNRAASADSRQYGFFSGERLLGTVKRRLSR